MKNLNVNRLRGIIRRYGNPGVLFVAGYLAIRNLWARRRRLCLLAGTAFLFVSGLVIWRTRLPQALSKPTPPVSQSASSFAPIDPVELENALREAEKMLTDCRDAPFGEPNSTAGSIALSQAEDAFSSILVDYGETVRAYLGMAECRRRLGYYERAEEIVQRVLTISPGNPAALAELENVRSLIQTQKILYQRIPAGQEITEMKRFAPKPGQTFWATLHGKTKASGDGEYHYEAMYLTVFSAAPDCRQVGQSYRLTDDRFDGRFYSMEVYALDMTRDGVPELIVQETTGGGSWFPSQMEVFTWRNGQPARILQAHGRQQIDLEDINHDGTFQVVASYQIGEEMSHAAQPEWSDIYAYNGERFEIADRRFPQRFQKYAEALEAARADYPQDREVQAYLCLAYSLLGRETEAKPLRQKAARYFRRRLAEDKNDKYRGTLSEMNCLRSHLADILR